MTRRRVRWAAALSLATAALIVAPGVSSAAASPACTRTSATNDLSKAAQDGRARPVVFVHGWNSDHTALENAARTLARQTGGQIRAFFYDYGPVASTWAAAPEIAACLADFVTNVSTGYRAAGGDGKVLAVAHSMGGLALRYASDAAYANHPIGNVLAGVVTLGTPYLGSPFGGSFYPDVVDMYRRVFEHVERATPVYGSNAGVCLAQRQPRAPLPAACHWALPPWLPPSVPVAEVAGDVVVRRTMLGVSLYDMYLGSDGIVPTPSAQGYVSSGPAKAPGGNVRSTSDRCVVRSDSLKTAAASYRLTDSVVAAGLATLAQLWADDNALSGLLDGDLTPGLVAYLGMVTAAAPCSHIHLYDDQSALNQATETIKGFLTNLRAVSPPATPPPPPPKPQPQPGAWAVFPAAPPPKICATPRTFTWTPGGPKPPATLFSTMTHYTRDMGGGLRADSLDYVVRAPYYAMRNVVQGTKGTVTDWLPSGNGTAYTVTALDSSGTIAGTLTKVVIDLVNCTGSTPLRVANFAVPLSVRANTPFTIRGTLASGNVGAATPFYVEGMDAQQTFVSYWWTVLSAADGSFTTQTRSSRSMRYRVRIPRNPWYQQATGPWQLATIHG